MCRGAGKTSYVSLNTEEHLFVKIHYHEIILTLIPKQAWMMPPSPGTMIRGAFGEKFRRIHCTMDNQQPCHSCIHHRKCVVPQWFDPGVLGSGSIRGWALHILPWPSQKSNLIIDKYTPLHVRILLLEPLQEHNNIMKSIRMMLEQGLGKNRIVHHAQRIEINGVPFYDWVFTKWPKPMVYVRPKIPSGNVSIRLQLRTPFIPSKSSAEENIEDPYVWWRAAVRRIRLILEYQGKKWKETSPVPKDVRINTQLRSVALSRYSKRQRAHLKFEGYEGTIFLKGPFEQLAPFFHAEPFQIGRATTLGCGAYTLLY